MNWQEVWGVLKWVLAALVAGFVGQFGKSLSLFLMRRRRNRKDLGASAILNETAPKASSPKASAEQATLETQAKIEKKRAKAEVKRLKKL